MTGRTSLKPLIAFAWLGVTVVTGMVLSVGRDVLIPLALAMLIWQLINAIARLYKKIRIMGQSPNRWLRLVLSISTISIGIGLAINMILANVAQVSEAAPGYERNLQLILPGIFNALGVAEPPTISQLVGQLDVTGLVSRLTSALASLAGNIALVALYVVFLLIEQETFGRKLDALFDDRRRAAEMRLLFRHIEKRVETYLWIKTAISVVTGVLSWIVLKVVGVNYAEFWAVIVFLLNFIPTIGSILGVLLPTMLTLLQFAELTPVLLVAIGLGVVQFTLGNVIEPRLMGNSLNLSPIVMIVSLALWGSLWGVAGMFLAVPIMVSTTIVLAAFRPTRNVAIMLSANGRID